MLLPILPIFQTAAALPVTLPAALPVPSLPLPLAPPVANAALKFFIKGGVVMWPLLVCLVVALLVLMERALWWLLASHGGAARRRDKVLALITGGDFAGAEKLCEARAGEPFLDVLRTGLRHRDGQFLGAMQVEAAEALDAAGRRLWLLSTLITLAPLLGLLGTVTGIMLSFNTVGGDELAIAEVKGGIAEALIATASGLVVAILCLLPHNYFHRRRETLRHALEQTINRFEIALATGTARSAHASVPASQN
ncbi:MAG: MotA/TolQ/ExbB proton channel family protein [Puniceicoccales bacterium]|jgi:biopolymer transport protein ExbB|nr:MotA/TolQ/ExbB proton channel family protein [Puniceicoccales bacterium]